MEQAYQRLFCPLIDKTPQEMNEMDTDELDNMVNSILGSFPNHSRYDYKPARTFSVADIYSYCNTTFQEFNGKFPIGGIYLDYLTLIKPSSKNDLRIQLGEIIQDLTKLSINFDCPVVTATQLNREKVFFKNPYELNSRLTGESHLINCNADSVMFLGQDEKRSDIVYFNSGVQRNNTGNYPMVFEVDFNKLHFKKLNKYDPSSEKNSSVTEEMLKFTESNNPVNKNFEGFEDNLF
jgi:replicative DNA helicase